MPMAHTASKFLDVAHCCCRSRAELVGFKGMFPFLSSSQAEHCPHGCLSLASVRAFFHPFAAPAHAVASHVTGPPPLPTACDNYHSACPRQIGAPQLTPVTSTPFVKSTSWRVCRRLPSRPSLQMQGGG